MTIGHRVAVFNEGRLQMLATPDKVYNSPSNIFVAKFIGSPSMNIIKGNYEDGYMWFKEKRYHIHEAWRKVIFEESRSDILYLGIRPEDILISEKEEKYAIKGIIKYIENYGSKKGVYIDIGSTEIIAIVNNSKFTCGKEVNVVLKPEKIHIFDGKSSNSLGYPDLIKDKMSVA